VPISDDVILGEGVSIPHPGLVNLYGCSIGAESKVGPFVEISRGVAVGKRCKISSHSFLCEGVTVEDNVFVGHGVMFTNDMFPRATTRGELQQDGDWEMLPTLVRSGASIGSGATVLCGLTIGVEAMVGAGAVVTQDVPDYAIVVGCPARVVGDVRQREAADGDRDE
jgi:UDP-2-acetamido-3-amino-2,3-dideoxy-glucuronate N-acetyltransferase